MTNTPTTNGDDSSHVLHRTTPERKADKVNPSTNAEMIENSRQCFAKVLAEAKEGLEQTSQATGQPIGALTQVVLHTCGQIPDKMEELPRLEQRSKQILKSTSISSC
jgi:hypothetical protein